MRKRWFFIGAVIASLVWWFLLQGAGQNLLNALLGAG